MSKSIRIMFNTAARPRYRGVRKKLTPADIAKIRTMLGMIDENGPVFAQREIAAKYRVSEARISRIKNGKRPKLAA